MAGWTHLGAWLLFTGRCWPRELSRMAPRRTTTDAGASTTAHYDADQHQTAMMALIASRRYPFLAATIDGHLRAPYLVISLDKGKRYVDCGQCNGGESAFRGAARQGGRRGDRHHHQARRAGGAADALSPRSGLS